MKIRIAEILGLLMTFGGIIWFIHGNFTDGLLLMILGELVDLPYIIKNKYLKD